ncbi:MAG: hypothetical protein AVDCRST_MAG04-2716 [uncultured Acetobacteraceae bacterium]|uniref:Uncharacterized protein n=1 Tax=uncultured Acetobacteraceae bacterium TaxID=169975 RepID=A0A6J4IY39_9PROT|nr:MAG: hypothetical protein AVDCRST_MAG04-2716 [uncultured Acetobacteraceae bacterium]
MRAGTRLAAALAFLWTGLAAFSAVGQQAAAVGSVNLKLDGCTLVVSRPDFRRSFDLLAPSACDFHRNRDQSLRVVTFRGREVLIVESARRGSAAQPNAGPGGCETRLFPVVLNSSDVVVLTEPIAVAACPPFRWDEKVFTAAAEKAIEMRAGER